MIGKHFDGLCDVIERTVVECRERDCNDAMSAHEIAHVVLEYLDHLPPSWRIS